MFVKLLFSKFKVYKHYRPLCFKLMIKLKIFQVT